ncbi:hypothetical protein GZL_07652 [Streptomyces sp. 769]|nr:hypothetical protein GZL_07652 [Streptomyces sp. 769]
MHVLESFVQPARCILRDCRWTGDGVLTRCVALPAQHNLAFVG